MEFKFNVAFWEADVRLPAWAGFLDGESVKLSINSDGRGEGPMNAYEVAHANWVVENQEWQCSALISAVVEAFPEIRRQFFEAWEGFKNEEDFPSVATTDDLAKVLKLDFVHVHQISKEGLPYVGYEFSCSWDEEHGLGVLMHGCRVVEIGEADTSFLWWIAQRDCDG